MATKTVKKPVSVSVVHIDDLKVAPRKVRASQFDPIAKALYEADNPNKAVVFDVPADRDIVRYRSQVYAAMHRSLGKLNPKAKFKVRIRVLEGNKFGISAAW